MKFVASIWCALAFSVQNAVLDPALYLGPSPPLLETRDSVPPGDLWPSSVEVRSAREAGDVLAKIQDTRPTSKRKPLPMEKAKLFWPSSSSTNYRVGAGSIQIPLTFSLSGLYGKYSGGHAGTSIIGSSYGTVSEIGGTAVSALAGTGYGNYRTYTGLRIYGGENGPAWSGWGNGKWGNYGKG